MYLCYSFYESMKHSLRSYDVGLVPGFSPTPVPYLSVGLFIRMSPKHWQSFTIKLRRVTRYESLTIEHVALLFYCQHLDCKLILDLEYLTSFLSRLPSLRLTHGHGADMVTVAGLSGLESLQCERCPLDSIQVRSLLCCDQ